MGIEEHVLDIAACGIDCRRLAGSELLEDLDAGVVGIPYAVLGEGGFLGDGLLDALVVTEVFIDVFIGGKTE